jgi:hypothetical protein
LIDGDVIGCSREGGWPGWKPRPSIRIDDEEIMSPEGQPLPETPWTAAELWKLPKERRDAVLEAAAVLAEEQYRNDPELTHLEASGPADSLVDEPIAVVRATRRLLPRVWPVEDLSDWQPPDGR